MRPVQHTHYSSQIGENLDKPDTATPDTNAIRFAAITDIHHYPTGKLAPEIAYWKLSEHAPRNAVDFRRILSSGDYDFGINLGDSIEDSGSAPNGDNIDRQSITEVVTALKESPQAESPLVGAQHIKETPLYYAIGNHDTVNITPEALTEITGCQPFYSFDEGAFHFVVLHSVADKHDPTNTQIPKNQLDWLAEDLSANHTRPTVVFLHHALSERSATGNHWFEPNPAQAFVKNRAAVRSLFKAAGNVCLVMNGHLHDNNIYRDPDDNTPYVTLQSATENIGQTQPANAWADITLTQKGATISVKGNDPVEHNITFPAPIQALFENKPAAAICH